MLRLKTGDKAPDFAAPDQDGNMVRLEDFRGKKLIIYFYPKDNSPGCTVQAENMRDGQEELTARGFVTVGVSRDSVRSHTNFKDKKILNFTLLSDADNAMALAYGVWGEKQFMGRTVTGIKRTTFVIDGDGIIERIFDKVNTKNHWQQILDSYDSPIV